jgi:hypothetical protein
VKEKEDKFTWVDETVAYPKVFWVAVGTISILLISALTWLFMTSGKDNKEQPDESYAPSPGTNAEVLTVKHAIPPNNPALSGANEQEYPQVTAQVDSATNKILLLSKETKKQLYDKAMQAKAAWDDAHSNTDQTARRDAEIIYNGIILHLTMRLQYFQIPMPEKLEFDGQKFNLDELNALVNEVRQQTSNPGPSR